MACVCSGKCVATGWGFTKEAGSPSDILKKVVVPIVSDEKCRDTYKNIKLITADMICAGYDAGGKDACKVSSIAFGTVDAADSRLKRVFG